MWLNSPSKENSWFDSAARTISSDSRKRSRDSPIGTRKPSNSTRPAPRPKPRVSFRPAASTSSMATSSATRIGSCQGRTTTIVPKSTRSVRPAMNVRNCSELGTIV